MENIHDSRFSDQWINLAEERLGAKVIFATDDFFAEKENLIKPGRGVFIDDKYTDRGKWMDGWESRRKRTEGHDYAVIKLGLSGIIKGVDIDTNHFTGNHPESAGLEACCLKEGESPDENTEWEELLAPQKMNPGSQHLFEIYNTNRFTHVRLHIYPDGGVARLRVYGEVQKDWSEVSSKDLLDLVAVENEGKALICSDMFFSHKDNINAPGRGIHMGDGWETKRRRGPGHDWIILSLGKAGKIEKVIVDTAHFKGNYPHQFSLDGVYTGKNDIPDSEVEWKELIGKEFLTADKEHVFTKINQHQKISHVRLNIFPDGGVSRLRVFGYIHE